MNLFLSLSGGLGGEFGGSGDMLKEDRHHAISATGERHGGRELQYALSSPEVSVNRGLRERDARRHREFECPSCVASNPR